ncbi:hypothetical protein [Nitrosomonas sp.]|uniref:deoxynucleotide monophosphate kinase family protein n=1 Tax=Nitrosomonas sp. TaxID=42353 RepID=UPI0025E36253|nr:hypothetical protein [Nitrosomonas sp.]
MSEPIKLIGLHGPAGCGKDTIAEILGETQEFRRVSFAEPLIDMLVAGFRISKNYFVDRDLKETPLDELCGKSPRQLMQTLGTEWGRDTVCGDIWVRIAGRKIDYLKQLAAAGNAYIEGIVATDVRFQNECDYIRSQGGEIWHIHRPTNPYQISTNHVSAKPMDIDPDHDRIILNDGDIDHLAEKINLILHPTIKEAS